jgi:predicted DNA-binding protein (MmcQ/YjbR family)
MRGEDKELKRLRDICMGIFGVVETSSWGHANWRVGKKLFATFEENRGVKMFSFFAGNAYREELLEDKRFSLPRYTDNYGWVSLRLDRDTDWKEVRALAIAAHKVVRDEKPAES